MQTAFLQHISLAHGLRNWLPTAILIVRVQRPGNGPDAAARGPAFDSQNVLGPVKPSFRCEQSELLMMFKIVFA